MLAYKLHRVKELWQPFFRRLPTSAAKELIKMCGWRLLFDSFFCQSTRNLAGSVFPKDERSLKILLMVVIDVAGDGSTAALSKTS